MPPSLASLGAIEACFSRILTENEGKHLEAQTAEKRLKYASYDTPKSDRRDFCPVEEIKSEFTQSGIFYGIMSN